MTGKIDYCKQPLPQIVPHWWHASQAEDRWKGYYFWNPEETFCFGPFPYERQAKKAQESYDAGAGIPDFDEENNG